jgi:hypothetical protein
MTIGDEFLRYFGYSEASTLWRDLPPEGEIENMQERFCHWRENGISAIVLEKFGI